MAEQTRATDLAVTRVDETGITVTGSDDVVLDVLFDGRRVWSFWAQRDTEDEGHGGRVAPWPKPLARYLDGVVELTVRAHVAEEDLFSRELGFGSSAERIEVVNAQGVELALDKSGRLQMTFDTRDAAQVTPLLDSVDEVLAALHEAGVEAFPAYGTLLGAHRDGALIGHDSDADLGYVSRYTDPVDVIRESYRIQRRLAAAGYEIVRYSGGGIKVLVKEPDGNTRGLDVFSGFIDAQGNLILMGEIRTPFEASWIFPLGSTTLEGRTLPAPAEPDHLLAAAYGPSWHTPDPAFKFETPESTTSRLNDWFRGTSVNRDVWDRRYQSTRFRAPVEKPDNLARIVARDLAELDDGSDDPTLVVDLGCGRGHDTRWLAEQGLTTWGLDFSARGYEYVATAEDAAALPMRFWPMNLLELRHVLGFGARVGAQPGRHVILARHLLDALSLPARRNFWRFLSMVARPGDRAYLEFLISDAEDDQWAQRNHLTALDPDRVEQNARRAGATVLSRHRLDSEQMNVRRTKDDSSRDSRKACRMVIEWPA